LSRLKILLFSLFLSFFFLFLGLRPNLFTFNSLILACVEDRQGTNNPAVATALLDDITKCGLEPNEETYHNLIACYLKFGQIREVEELVERLGYQGVVCSAKTSELVVHYYISEV
jgi:hypothetical protein